MSKYFNMQIKFYLASLLFTGITYNMHAQDTTKAKLEFKASGKVWGYVFGDYYYKLHADSMNRGTGEYSNMKENANAFAIRRAYLGYDYNISEKFSAEFLLSHENSYDVQSNRAVFIKAANVKWKNILPKNDLVIGQSATPTWSFVSEKMWGYRSVEKTVTDIHKAGSSNDLGIALQGKIDSAGNFGYNLMVGNGTGSKIENDVFKKMYAEVYAKFLDKKLVVDLYTDYERIQLQLFHKSKMTSKIFLGYQTEKITVGLEAFQQVQQNYAMYTDTTVMKGDTTDVSLFGTAVFLKGVIIKDKLTFFVRADLYDPDSNFNKDYVYAGSYSGYNTEMFSVAGFDYTPMKNIHIIPNVWYRSYQSRAKGASGLAKTDYDLVPRITVHYVFK